MSNANQGFGRSPAVDAGVTNQKIQILPNWNHRAAQNEIARREKSKSN